MNFEEELAARLETLESIRKNPVYVRLLTSSRDELQQARFNTFRLQMASEQSKIKSIQNHLDNLKSQQGMDKQIKSGKTQQELYEDEIQEQKTNKVSKINPPENPAYLSALRQKQGFISTRTVWNQQSQQNQVADKPPGVEEFEDFF